MKKVVRMLRNHEQLIVHSFKAPGTISAGNAERLNKVKLATKKAYSFRIFNTAKTALKHFPSQNSPTSSAERAFIMYRLSRNWNAMPVGLS